MLVFLASRINRCMSSPQGHLVLLRSCFLAVLSTYRKVLCLFFYFGIIRVFVVVGIPTYRISGITVRNVLYPRTEFGVSA